MQDIIVFIQHHGMLSLALVIILTLLIIVEFIRSKHGTNQLSPADATQLINHQNAVIVDIRSPENFASGHLVESLSLPMNDIATQHKKLEKYKSQPVLLVCATGVEALKAAGLLTKLGFNVFIIKGGIRAWRTADMPLVKG